MTSFDFWFGWAVGMWTATLIAWIKYWTLKRRSEREGEE